ncbi:hypothetical protein E8A74_05020 [Polyangium fumosum]|uniref:Uncharacterized protein n=1 Tax=Polyangium fumosum TaxID=889272 RepID=A0A4U1JIH4_9BACT|nr:hypothetical protein E8A74_05020 [Polyangium fumosum]
MASPSHGAAWSPTAVHVHPFTTTSPPSPPPPAPSPAPAPPAPLPPLPEPAWAPPTQTLMDLHVPVAQAPAASQGSTTMGLSGGSAASGSSQPPTQLISCMQNERSAHVAPPLQSASVAQFRGSQCGPP